MKHRTEGPRANVPERIGRLGVLEGTASSTHDPSLAFASTTRGSISRESRNQHDCVSVMLRLTSRFSSGAMP